MALVRGETKAGRRSSRKEGTHVGASVPTPMPLPPIWPFSRGFTYYLGPAILCVASLAWCPSVYAQALTAHASIVPPGDASDTMSHALCMAMLFGSMWVHVDD